MAPRITRRELMIGTAAAAGGTLAGLRLLRQPPYDAAQFPVPTESPVAILPAASYAADFQDVVARGLRLLDVDVRGRRVLLKPNMVEYQRDSAINTHATVVVGAALAFLSAGAATVVVGEGPGHRRDVEYLLTQTGLWDHLREARIRFADLNHDDVRWTPLRSRFTGMESLALPVALLESDFVVSMPKLKTHHWTGLTCSMKNFFGVVPGAVYGWPKNILHAHGIENSILDLVATVRPQLAIVDGVVGMEGDGPIMGTPKPVGCLVMGSDPVAVDATCARLIALEPERLDYIATASSFLGNMATTRIRQRGESVDRFTTSFDAPPPAGGSRWSA